MELTSKFLNYIEVLNYVNEHCADELKRINISNTAFTLQILGNSTVVSNIFLKAYIERFKEHFRK